MKDKINKKQTDNEHVNSFFICLNSNKTSWFTIYKICIKHF